MSLRELNGSGVTAPKGFVAGVAMAGIKKPGVYDLTIVHSTADAAFAGVFTVNKVKAAPVVLSQAHLAICSGRGRAAVFNSGCANACTGDQGMEDAKQMAVATGKALGCAGEEVLVASTGVIGAYLPMDKVLAGISTAASGMDAKNGALAAQAIMTTDLAPKEVAVEVDIDGHVVTLGAMAKGSGMIHPNMGTLLAMVTSDCAIEPGLLQELLAEVCDDTFNMVTIDGDMSTNDCLFAFANGLASNPLLREKTDPGYGAFKEGLMHVCRHLAQLIAKDGEGATKFIEVAVEGAKTRGDARLAARAVVSSSLVKAAIYGKDANWGRVLCAMGYSGADFDPGLVDLFLGDLQMMGEGRALIFDEAKALDYLDRKDIRIVAKLHQGQEGAVAWGCDLTHDYVTINASYRS